MAYKEYYAYATRVAAPKPKASARKKKGDSYTSLTPPIVTPTPITTVAPVSRLSAATKDFVYQIEHKKQKKGIEMYYPRFMKVVIHHFMSKDLSIPRRNKINWHYVRDDNIFSTIKVVSRHQDTQQYRAILPIELTNEDIRNTTAYKEYYAYATEVAAPKPKASARKKRGDSDTSLTPPIATPTPITTAALVPRLSAAAKGTGSRPGVPNVPSDDSELELSWNSSDDEDVDAQVEGDKTLAKIDEPKDTKSGRGGDEVTESEGESDEKETRQEEEESFDPIPRTPERSEDEGNDEEDQDLRLREEERIQEEEEEEADELYHDVDINQGRGLQVSQNIEDSHVTLTPVHPDGLQESSSVSSFVTSMLNPISDTRVESIFTTASSPIVSLQTPTPIMTPSTIAIITTSSDAPIPPTTIPSTILENLPTFNLIFSFDERLKSLETTFSEYRQTNPFVDDVFVIPGFVHQYMTQQMTEAIQERRREDDDQEGPSAGSDRGSKRRREGGEDASASTPSETDTGSGGRSTTWSQSRQLSASAEDQPIVQTSQYPEWFSHPRRPPTPNRDWNKTLPTAQGNAQSWISELARQTDGRSSFNELLDTPIDFSNFIMNRLSVDTLTPELLAGPTYELMRGSCNSLTELEYQLEEVYKATMDQLDWVNPKVEGYDADKTILDTYGESTILKRRREDDDQEGPSAGSDRGSKRQREGGEHASASAPSETTTGSAGRSTIGSQSRQLSASAKDQPIVQTSQHPEWFSQPRRPPSPDRDWNKTLPAAQGNAQSWISILARQTNARSSFNELLDTPIDFSNFIMNRLGPLSLILDNRGRRVIPFEHFINNDLEYLRGCASSRTPCEEFLNGDGNVSSSMGSHLTGNLLSMYTPRGGSSLLPSSRLWNDTTISIWIGFRKLSNLTVEERFDFNVSLRMFTRSIVIQSDGTLKDVRNALDDRLKGIQMQYLPTTIWRRGDKDRAAAMIQYVFGKRHQVCLWEEVPSRSLEEAPSMSLGRGTQYIFGKRNDGSSSSLDDEEEEDEGGAALFSLKCTRDS
nr:hypothetical protein [Tanacetum cinerariifolium]